MDGVKKVGHRRIPTDPTERLRLGEKLNQEAELLNPHPRPPSFIYKARTWEEYEEWRRNHPNPRYW